MKIVDTFIAKDGKKINIVFPDLSLVKELTDFVNRLCQEDTFLTFSPEQHFSLEAEKNHIQNSLNEIKFNNLYLIWAMYEGKIIGICDVKRKENRRHHIGGIGLMVDKDLRGLGIGEYLFSRVLNEAKKIGYKMIRLEVFSDNLPAISLYKKYGLKEYGRLPKGLYRKEKFVDEISMFKELK